MVDTNLSNLGLAAYRMEKWREHQAEKRKNLVYEAAHYNPLGRAQYGLEEFTISDASKAEKLDDKLSNLENAYLSQIRSTLPVSKVRTPTIAQSLPTVSPVISEKIEVPYVAPVAAAEVVLPAYVAPVAQPEPQTQSEQPAQVVQPQSVVEQAYVAPTISDNSTRIEIPLAYVHNPTLVGLPTAIVQRAYDNIVNSRRKHAASVQGMYAVATSAMRQLPSQLQLTASSELARSYTQRMREDFALAQAAQQEELELRAVRFDAKRQKLNQTHVGEGTILLGDSAYESARDAARSQFVTLLDQRVLARMQNLAAAANQLAESDAVVAFATRETASVEVVAQTEVKPASTAQSVASQPLRVVEPIETISRRRSNSYKLRDEQEDVYHQRAFENHSVFNWLESIGPKTWRAIKKSQRALTVSASIAALTGAGYLADSYVQEKRVEESFTQTHLLLQEISARKKEFIESKDANTKAKQSSIDAVIQDQSSTLLDLAPSAVAPAAIKPATSQPVESTPTPTYLSNNSSISVQDLVSTLPSSSVAITSDALQQTITPSPAFEKAVSLEKQIIDAVSPIITQTIPSPAPVVTAPALPTIVSSPAPVTLTKEESAKEQAPVSKNDLAALEKLLKPVVSDSVPIVAHDEFYAAAHGTSQVTAGSVKPFQPEKPVLKINRDATSLDRIVGEEDFMQTVTKGVVINMYAMTNGFIPARINEGTAKNQSVPMWYYFSKPMRLKNQMIGERITPKLFYERKLVEDDALNLASRTYRLYEKAIEAKDPAALNASSRDKDVDDAVTKIIVDTLKMTPQQAKELTPAAIERVARQLNMTPQQLKEFLGFYLNF